ncbi:hypothetical protein ACFU8I_41130, partial [Streptomyces sp. NPDC057540]
MAEQHTPRSLIVSLYGAYGRAPDESPVPVAALIRLLGVLGVDAPSVRSSVSRLKRRGLLLPGRTAAGGGRGGAHRGGPCRGGGRGRRARPLGREAWREGGGCL